MIYPFDYYQNEFPEKRLNPEKEWAKVRCCFHDDKKPSLTLNLRSGRFRCFGCGLSGNSILDFHFVRHGKLLDYGGVM